MKTWMFAALALSGLGGWAQAQDAEKDWRQSQFGEDDRLGAVNHLTAEKTARAAGLITTGKTYALGMVTGRDTPTMSPRKYDVYVVQADDGSGEVNSPNKVTSNDDMVQTFVGIGSQIDGLGHIGIGHEHYNGVHVREFVSTSGLSQFGTESLPPIATRGILLDMTKQFDSSPVPDGTAFNRAEIEAALASAEISLEPGDVVIFHTGKMTASEGKGFSAPIPGLGVEGAQFLADQGVVAVGADTWALEVIPFEQAGHAYAVHQTLLAKNGVYILENMVTDELAADGVTEFFFSLGVPRLEGTVQAIINPVGIR